MQNATTRIVYDLDCFRRTQAANPTDKNKWLPPYAATLARETHVSDPLPTRGLKIQISFSYSDGFGREIQKKIQAEPEKNNGVAVPPRWVGSGWTIFNNKGKPVRQYEPFFSQLPPAERHHFEFGVMVGVSPVLFYDPVERVVATLHPNHAYEKVLFDPWQQTTWDVNDTLKKLGPAAPPFDPKSDPDVGHYFERLLDDYYLPTWYDMRTDAAKALLAWPDSDAQGRPLPDNAKRRAAEKSAAEKAVAHVDTPTTAHFDALGRPFLTLVHNRVVCANHTLDGTEDMFATRVELDIEGNQREVRDANKKARDAQGNEVIDELGRIVMRYDYDMLGNRIHQLSMEAGARWMLNDVAGKPIRTWDSRSHSFRTEYDPLRRPLRINVTGADPANSNQELLTERLVYSEQHPEAEPRNLRGKLYLHLDQAGVITNEAHDFKGNPLRASRRLTNGTQYKQAMDWRAVDADHVVLPTDATALLDPLALEAALAPRLEADTYTSTTTYDALNRPVTLTPPHIPTMLPSVIRPGYNEANLLERMEVNLRGATANGQPVWTPFVSNIDYDAKGQRELIDYGNGVRTTYDYDPLTFRLVHLLTGRNAVAFPEDCPQNPPVGWPGCQVQNLLFTYDPAGNITHIQDNAQQTIYFKNQRVEPSHDFTYDATYRLIEATGREHLGQGGAPIPHSYNDVGRVGVLSADTAGRFAPNDRNAMDRYCEKYVYDEVGNFMEMSHHRSCPAAPSWTRTYTYAESSPIEPAKQSNRLSRTTVGNNNPIQEQFGHDVHGNMLRMPQLQVMQWDYKDQLQMTQRQKINDEDIDGVERNGERTWYVYDSAGQRVRKVTERQAAVGQTATRMKERIYLGGFEIYREYENDGDTVTLERETLHIMDDKQRIALVETKTLDSQHPAPSTQHLIRFQMGDHLGSASLELDDQAQIISYEEYTSYGSTSYQAVRSKTEAPKRYRYTGKERDEESGLYYHGARYYALWLGRWTSCDRAGLVDGSNLYAYARCRPTILVDPNGHNSAPPQAAQVKINDVVPYNQKLTNRSSIGVNPQKDHVISQGKQKLINPNIDASKQLTVVQETGAAKGNAPAKPHTRVTFHDPQSDVAEISRLRGMKPQQWTSFEQEVLSPSLESRYRAGYSKSSTNIAAIDEVGSMFEVNQPNRAPNSSGPKLDWTQKAKQVGPAVDPETGRVIPKSPANNAAPEPVAEPVTEPVAKAPAAKAAPTARSGASARVRSAGGTGLKVLGALGVAVAVKDVVKSVKEGNYGRAAITTGATALGFTPLAPVVMAGGVIAKYYTDSTIEQRAFAAGDWVQERTGSAIVGGIASAGTAVGLSIYETGVDMVHGIRGLFTDW